VHVGNVQYVVAFAASGAASNWDRLGKPFNPLLGETYELDRCDTSLIVKSKSGSGLAYKCLVTLTLCVTGQTLAIVSCASKSAIIHLSARSMRSHATLFCTVPFNQNSSFGAKVLKSHRKAF
jgi:hypothetical protein